MNYRFMDVVVPHSPVDIQAAIAAATVVHVATVMVVDGREINTLHTVSRTRTRTATTTNSASTMRTTSITW